MALLPSGVAPDWGTWYLGWLSLDFLVLLIACRTGVHRLFGKRPDGALSWWGWVLFGPLLLYTWLVWALLKYVRREPAWNVVNSSLSVGRRFLPSEAPADHANYVDLTAEFIEPKALRILPGYRSFPILDAMAPSAKALMREVATLPPGRTFVHCAMGHGRTGLFAAALLLYRGEAATVGDSLAMLRLARPGIALKRRQMACLHEFHALLMASSPPAKPLPPPAA